MKKSLLTILVIAICVSALSGCAFSGERFDFSLSIEKEKYARGETISITAEVTNVSGMTYRYVGCSGNDFIPTILLYFDGDVDGQKYYIPCDPIVLPTDVVAKKVKNGERGSTVYTFVIPEDAPLGNYDVTLFMGKDNKEFLGVLEIVELNEQNETEKYSYSSAIISSGNSNIRPIKTFLYRGPGDGLGCEGIFSDQSTDQSDFPTLVADGQITVAASQSSRIGDPIVYDLDYKRYEYSGDGWEELRLLPSGEYIVVFSEVINVGDKNNETGYEDVFKLVIE